MNLQEFAKLLRARWLTVASAALVAVLGAVVLNLLTTPLYQASTRLFVSTTAGASVTDIYQGNLFSQQRVKSYTQLVMGETLAQRTIDKLGLDTTAKSLQERIKAHTQPDTVLIDVDVLDASPVQARDIANALSDEFVALVRQLETPDKGGTPNARVVVEQRASIPDHPVIPKTFRNLVVGLALGVMLGVGLAVLRDLLDNTVKSQEALEELTSAGTVGYIPFDKELRKSPALSFDTDHSGAAEAFRKVRTNLQFLNVDNPPQLIVITSSSPAEGKSTTAINIALALAEAEHSVLLIDGDMRRPRLAKYLGVVGSVGFSSVLSGAAELADVVQQTRFPRLTVLTAGPIPPNPSELLASQAARKLLSEARERFDYVIIDSSPLLAVTDGAILAANADGALVVARFGETKREHLSHAVRNLNDVGATVLGAVFTMMPTRGGSAYSYNYYSHGYGYGDRGVGTSPASASSQAPAAESIQTGENPRSEGANRNGQQRIESAQHAEAGPASEG